MTWAIQSSKPKRARARNRIGGVLCGVVCRLAAVFLCAGLSGIKADEPAVTRGPGKIVTRYALTSSHDLRFHDPKRWRLFGSNDGGRSWTLLDLRTNQFFSACTQRRIYRIPNRIPYSTYRLEVDETREPSSATFRQDSSVQLAELELLGPVVGASSETELRRRITSSEPHPLMGPPENAFDRDLSTRWFDLALQHSNACWIQCQYVLEDEIALTNLASLQVMNTLARTTDPFLEKGPRILSNYLAAASTPLQAISGYALTSANDAPGRDPSDWRLLGSNDGGKHWDTLDARRDVVFANRFQRRVFALTNSAAYALYRLEITGLHGGGSLLVQLSEIEPLTVNRGSRDRFTVVVSAKTDNPPMEAVEMAFDGDPKTKWLSFAAAEKQDPAWVQWQFVPRERDLPVIDRHAIDRLYNQTLQSNLNARATWPLCPMSGYALVSANDNPERDPKNWKLLGSSDGGEHWDIVDARTNQTFDNRFQRRVFSLPRQVSYRAYRFEIDSVADPAAANSVQLGEFEPLDAPGRAAASLSVIVSSQGENPPVETAELLFDGNPATKWLDFADASTNRASWFEWQYATGLKPKVVNLDQLHSNEAKAAKPARLSIEGATVFWNSNSNLLGLLDETGFEMLELDPAPPDIRPGERVRLSGLLHPGPDIPKVLKARVERLDDIPSRARSKSEDAPPWAERLAVTSMQGRADALSSSRFYTTIPLQTQSGVGTVLARVFALEPLPIAPPFDCVLRVRGVQEPVLGKGNKPVPGVIWVAAMNDVNLAPPAPRDWGAWPEFSLESLCRSNLPLARLVRVRGRLLQQAPGAGLVLGQGTNRLEVLSTQESSFEADSEIESAGFCGGKPGAPVLYLAYSRLAPTETISSLPRPSASEELRGPIQQIRRIKKLMSSHPTNDFPVRIRGVITYINLSLSDFYIDDGTNGIAIWSQLGAGLSPFLEQEGLYVELEGVAHRGEVFPTAFVKVLGKGRMPEPLRHSWDYLITGRDDGQWVEVEGVVSSVEKQRLTLTVPGGQLMAWVKDIGPNAQQNLLGSQVCAQGVCAPILNSHGQRLGLRLLVPSTEYVRVIRAAPQCPFDLPAVPIGQVMKGEADASGLPMQAVKVTGVVTYGEARLIFVQDGQAGLRVFPRESTEVGAGDRVEVVGFPDPDGFSPKLVQALVRKVGRAALPAAIPLDPLDTTNNDEVINWDATRGQIEAVLLGNSHNELRQVLELEHLRTKQTFYAFLPAKGRAKNRVMPGSRVRLQGVFKCKVDPVLDFGQVVTSFEMYLNSPADVLVLTHPGWWTTRRTLWAAGGLAAALFLLLGWAALLRQQIRHRTAQLNEETAQHKRTAEALQTSERFMRSLVESLPQNILRKDIDGRFTFANGFLCRTLGKTMSEIIGKTDYDLFPQELAIKYRRDDQAVIASGKLFETVEENLNVAGEKIYVQVIKTPLYDAGNEPVGLQVIFWDVTERKLGEARLEVAHKKLVEASRQAGMAEVATSVLHNVGNVLNSVNVSTSLMAEQLKKSKIGNLLKAAKMMRDHEADIGTFMTADPKGRQLPDYFVRLAEHLAAEQANALEELADLAKNVDHIKDIVAVQQSYAKTAGVTESVQVTELVEDALRMNQEALARHKIQTVREYDAGLPEILVDKHKVLQILVNLIRNAKYACDDSSCPDKRLGLRIARRDGQIHISVGDNGVGIAPENITRIFNHGFTTRKNGHGFGLHSGAIAAKELGGSLSARSDGAGKGAEFTLTLPIAVAEPRVIRSPQAS